MHYSQCLQEIKSSWRGTLHLRSRGEKYGKLGKARLLRTASVMVKSLGIGEVGVI